MFYLNSLAESHKSLKVLLVDGPKLRQEPCVMVVDILKITCTYCAKF